MKSMHCAKISDWRLFYHNVIVFCVWFNFSFSLSLLLVTYNMAVVMSPFTYV